MEKNGKYFIAMDSEDKKNKPTKRQFQLVKFFAYAGFIVIVLFSFPFSMIISRQAKDILTKSYENYALLLGQNMQHQVFQNFAIPVLKLYGHIRLREKEQFEWMDRIIKSSTHYFNIDLVNIYDTSQGVIAYSTDPSLIGNPVEESLGYKKAVNGELFSGLISKGDKLWGLGIEMIGGKKKLRTFIPFRVFDPIESKVHLLGVFELIQDLTFEYQSIVKFQYLVFGLSILIMGLIFVALLLIVRKAEEIMEERAKAQRDLEAQLHEAERLAALGQMCAGVSHEIRNPLGIIRSTAELMSQMPDSKKAQRDLSKVIMEESTRLNAIVTEFLDFGRPMEPNLQECRLEEVIKKNLVFLKPEFTKSNISIRDNLDGRSFKMKGDPEMLYRAFLNVFINAIQSMKKKGTVTVNISDKNDHYIINIEDTGGGIKRENLKRIFNPFFSTKDRGSGLGLAIVRKIIEVHKGNIKIKSKKGTGTKVTITLPVG